MINRNLKKLQSCGVDIPYQRSMLPTKTFPNHYSIVTGLYPVSHGITANVFRDLTIGKIFSATDMRGHETEFWIGEPIWETIQKQGKTAATYFWPGSDVVIHDQMPNYWYQYDDIHSYERRIFQALEWLDIKNSTRPDMIILYFDEPDKHGHGNGPLSDGANEEIKRCDDMIGMLMNGLKQRGIDHCVNIVISSDHGMSRTFQDELIMFDEMSDIFDPDKIDNYYTGLGPVARIGENFNATEYEIDSVWKDLKCTRKEKGINWRAFKKSENLPRRFHYSDSERVEDLLFINDVGASTWLNSRGDYPNEGDHGYDNLNTEMRALSIMYGPSLKSGYKTDVPHENIELYNLFCELLNVEPSANNGTSGSMSHVLRNPVNYPEMAENLVQNLGLQKLKVLLPTHDLNLEAEWRGNSIEMKLNEVSEYSQILCNNSKMAYLSLQVFFAAM